MQALTNTQSKAPLAVTLSALKAGDILLFRTAKEVTAAQRLIMFLQSFSQQKHGHYDTIHAAICVGFDENGQPLIAHVDGGNNCCYVKEPLVAMFNRDQGDRPFFVFRPRHDEIAANIAHIAGKEALHKKIKWKVSAAIHTMFFNAKRDTVRPHQTISNATICSQFVIECLKLATLHAANAPFSAYPTIHASSTTKALESHLYQASQDYTMMCYLGENAFDLLKREIELQLRRIQDKADYLSQMKYLNSRKQFSNVLKHIDSLGNINETQKVMALLNAMLPLLGKRTGLSIAEPKSYRAVVNAARKAGIMQRDLRTPRMA